MKLNSNKYTIIIKSEQKPAEHDIINFPMYPIINISFNNTTMFTYIRPVKCNVRNKISENPLKKVCTCHHKIIPKQSL